MTEPLDLPAPSPASPADVLRLAAEATARGTQACLATVLARRGSAPSSPGQKLLLLEDGSCYGTVGGGAVEREVLLALVAALRQIAGTTHRESSKPGGTRDGSLAGHLDGKVHTFKLGAELGMCCGGSVDILVEVLVSAIPILLVGAGHIGALTAPLLAKCGFFVTMVDERPDWIVKTPNEPGVLRVLGEFDDVGRPLPSRAAILTMSHDHGLDQRVVEWAIRGGFRFVGGVGSRAKAARTRQRLAAKGFSELDQNRVRMPLGLAIGARSPEEIAVSIVAEMIAWRRAQS